MTAPSTTEPIPDSQGATTEIAVDQAPFVEENADGPRAEPLVRRRRGSGAGACVVPDVIGEDLVTAFALTSDVGLRMAVSTRESKIGPWGMVLVQTPEAGSRVRRGTRLSVVVAGRPHVAVPDVRGLDADAATEALRRHGLEVGRRIRRGSPSMPPGHALSTTPKAGEIVAQGMTVSIVVAGPRAAGDRSTQAGDRPR